MLRQCLESLWTHWLSSAVDAVVWGCCLHEAGCLKRAACLPCPRPFQGQVLLSCCCPASLLPRVPTSITASASASAFASCPLLLLLCDHFRGFASLHHLLACRSTLTSRARLPLLRARLRTTTHHHAHDSVLSHPASGITLVAHDCSGCRAATYLVIFRYLTWQTGLELDWAVSPPVAATVHLSRNVGLAAQAQGF